MHQVFCPDSKKSSPLVNLIIAPSITISQEPFLYHLEGHNKYFTLGLILKASIWMKKCK